MSPRSHTPALAASGEHPRRALILAGGGMRVAYQAGVLCALADHDLTFSHVDGTSGGIMNAAMLLSGIPPREMAERWDSLDVRRFSSLVSLEEYLKPHDLLSLGDADGIVDSVFPHLGIDVDRIRAATGMEGTFNVCNYTRKTVESIAHTTATMDHLIAGISLPIFMPPIRIGADLYTDAVWIKDANLLEAVRRGADELWVVWCIGNTPEYRRGSFHQYVHMIEMSANGGLAEELDRIREMNERIEAGERVGGRTEPVRLHVIRPQHALPLDPDFFFGRITAATLVELGHADADRYLRGRTPEGLPLDPEVTRMREPVPAVRFRETMEGGFALGATDPREGAALGSAQGTRLALHGVVTVRDFDRFLADPDHNGELVGRIDFDPLGTGLLGGQGVFRLFSPGGDARTKLMVYELPFRWGSVDYYLAGRKQVRDDPGPDAWKDLTTLFTTLHRGPDATAPIVGAGILTLGVIELKRMVASMTTLDTAGAAEHARLLARFGAFFGKEAFGTYAPLANADS